MESPVTEAFQWVIQFGAVAVLFLGVLAIMRGDLRTRQEVDKIEQSKIELVTQHETAMTTLKEQHEQVSVMQKAAYEAAIHRLDARLVQLTGDHTMSIQALRDEMSGRVVSAEDRANYFRDIAFQALQHGFQLASAAEKTVDLVSRESTAGPLISPLEKG
jgi:hypothetical protein